MTGVSRCCAARCERPRGNSGPTKPRGADIMGPVARHWRALSGDILGPLRIPHHPALMARFGLRALRSARSVANAAFSGDLAPAVFAGIAAHSMLPLDAPPTAAPAIVLGALASVGGWPIVRGGSQRLAEGLANYLRDLGGEIVTGHLVRSLDELPPSRAVLADVTPRQLIALAGARLPPRLSTRAGTLSLRSGHL